MSDCDFIEVKYKGHSSRRASNRGNGAYRGRGNPPRRAQTNSRSYTLHLESTEKIGNINEEIIKGKERILECL